MQIRAIGDKSWGQFGIEASSALFFGAKNKFTSKLLLPESKLIGEPLLELGNQLGNYGLQTVIKQKIRKDNNKENSNEKK